VLHGEILDELRAGLSPETDLNGSLSSASTPDETDDPWLASL
jgi:hypothetical protein